MARTAIIVGGGIGGLVTALRLHAIGIEVKVLETAREIRALGVGINLLPHAVRELTELGLASALAAIGVETAELCYYTKRGQRIWQEPRGRAAGYQWPQYSIHRGRLQTMLYDAVIARLGVACVVTGHHLDSFAQDATGVSARFVDRRTEEPRGEHRADMLIAADGIHSVARRHFYPDEGAPRFSGRILWRGVTEATPYLSGRTMIMAGYADQKFVAYPVDPDLAKQGRSLVNWIAELRVGFDHAPPRDDWNRPGDPAVFAPHFADWRFDWLDVPALIRDAQGIFEFPMVDRDPLPAWTFGRVTLLGDAAHPMYPIGSNGASQAILDSGVLATALTEHDDSADAFRAYEAIRRPATAAIVLANRQNGPEQVMQMVEERAPDGFEDLDEVISQAELEDVASRYKQVAGFDRERLNAKA